jgi:hypothetical protein
MRFPLIAQETLLRRGMADNQAQLAAGALSSMVAYIGLKYLREQAAISTGLIHPIDAKYDLENFDDDDWFRVTGEASMYIANLGMLGNVANFGLVMTGNPQMGKEWTDRKIVPQIVGPTGGLAETLHSLSVDAVSGNITTEKSLKRFKTLLPFNNFMLIKEGGDKLVEELGE